ncbi:MAG: tyrosine-type recombinase/integrase [Nanohaloarchaea archaeon]|nr:tyrosine-type recombinase/integrase [Candidatus Nanohaloarchaea archaeon]
MAAGDPNDFDEKLASSIQKIKTSDQISEHNKDVLLDFHQFLEEDGLSTGRIERPLTIWRIILVQGKEDFKLDEPAEEDIKRVAKKITNGDREDEDLIDGKDRIKEMSVGTQREYLKAVRKLVTGYLEDRKSNFKGENLINFTLPSEEKLLEPEKLPRPEHIEQMLNNVESLKVRNKALIMTLWGSGGRISEVLSLKWKDVNLSDQGGILHFRDTKRGGKNKKTHRKVPLLEGYIYLQQLRNHHEDADDPEGFVFQNSQTGEQLKSSAVRRLLNRIQERTEMPEEIRTNPHAIRKGKARYLAMKGWEYTDLCKFFGWELGSSVPKRYIRLADGDLQMRAKKFSRNHRVEEEELKEGYHFEPVKCPSCGELQRWDNNTCECGEELTESAYFDHVRIEETTQKLQAEIIKDQVGLDDEQINEKAKELVKEAKTL